MNQSYGWVGFDSEGRDVEIFKIDKPMELAGQPELMQSDYLILSKSSILRKAHESEYMPWSRFKYLELSKNHSPELLWGLVKQLRQLSPDRIDTPIMTPQGIRFSWQPPSIMPQVLHTIDMETGGAMATPGLTDTANRQWYVTRGIMEEAIASSQLEGAVSTRKRAKEMILQKIKPKNQSEQMILNNYQAMQQTDIWSEKPLTLDLLQGLHVLLCRDTGIHTNKLGVFRMDADEVVVADRAKNIIYHIPPPRAFLEQEIKKFIGYFNDKVEDGTFVHPVVKAILIHFWIGYLHPYVDGNGRLARALFYWYAKKHGYWAFSFLPISLVIKKSPAQYRDAYVYSEQDDFDVTYFIDYNLRKISQAHDNFRTYQMQKKKENRRIAALLETQFQLNVRQQAFIKMFFDDPSASISIQRYASMLQISRPTAQRDLDQLERASIVRSARRGNEKLYRLTYEARARLA